MPDRVSPASRFLSPSRARVAVVLSVLLLFFGIALFSPLHKHTLGKTNTCSFNNLEHQMVSLAEATAVLDPLAFLIEARTAVDAESPFAGLLIAARDRAPPALS